MTLTARGVLEVRLFGVPQVTLAGQVVSVPTKRAWGVVAYLALEGATSRDKLAAMLWDEGLVENPRRNLRQELYRLAKTPLADFLEVDELVSLRCCCDAQVARDSEVLITADFMSRFDVPQAPSFQGWLQMQRETFSRLRLSRLEAQAKALNGLPALEMWLEVLRADALRETAVQAAMRLEAMCIGKPAAFERYKGFKALLKSELGLEPLPETLALARELDLEKESLPKVKSDTRIDRLLEAAGLLGQPFEAPMLLDVTGLSDFEVLDVLETATKQGLLSRSGTHYKVLAVPKTLTSERKKILERRIAERLQKLGTACEVVAGHLERAGEQVRASQKFLEAAELANRQDRATEAFCFYNKVLELTENFEQRFKVLQSRILIARHLDNRIWREAVRDLEREARDRSPLERMTADMQRGLWHFSRAEYDKTLEFITPHLGQDGKIGALAAYMQGIVMVKTGQISSAKTHLERALQTKNALEDSQIAELHNVLCILAVQSGQMAIAKTHSQISLKGFVRTGNQMSLSRALSTAGVLEMLAGKHLAAMRMFKRSFEISQKIGDYASQIATLLNLSKSTFETARLEASHAYLEQGLGLLEQHPNEDLRGSYLVNIAALERTGLRLDSAWTRVETALELAKNQGASPKIASRSLILADLASERKWFEKTRFHLDLAVKHITPELQADMVLEEAKLELLQNQPKKTLELLLHLECQNDNIELRAGLMGLAYLSLKQPLEALKIMENEAQTIYQPLLQAVRIEAHAALGTLQANHFEPLPNKNSMPYMRQLLLQAFAKHHPEKTHFSKEAAKLERILQS